VTADLCRFKTCRPTLWEGRYARIPGDSSVFHLRYHNGRMWPVIDWVTEDGVGTCAALPGAPVEALANSVEAAKRQAGGTGGGSFVINEFGQVLVPASDGGGRRYLAGQLEGRLLFENPFVSDDVIDLGDFSQMQSGDPWRLPYVGVPYNLSGQSKIYFYHVDSNGGKSTYPPRQDTRLIQALRRVRRSGAVRFIVNPAGLVLTKCPIDELWSPEESWRPFFVGCIDRSVWFEME
jgi:hypothetical protein